MSARTIRVLARVLADGGEVLWTGPRPTLRVAPEFVRDIERDRLLIRDILARAQEFRRQLTAPPSDVLPTFRLANAQAPTSPRHCVSCGITSRARRCALCGAAVWLALDAVDNLAAHQSKISPR